ncbi:MAG TPA: protein kinase [Kofleriaceae bacterium]|nr:protein kinase [Kofleriaceae bacterium]
MFGRYLLVQRLSRGGMGEIFLAKHGLAGFEKLAVIKKVLPHLSADQQFISRFVDEAQVAIKLQHVNIAAVFEVGRVGNEYFLALEYVEGRDLRRTLSILNQKKQRLPVDLGLFIGRELANGLAYAHRRTTADGAAMNLVHCDISPPNVLVSFEGETKVIDFGIAKSAMRGTATDPKMGFGKFGYMAPEQLIRGGAVDHRTDIYAAGVVLFELLTGQRLYEAGPEPDYRALAKKVAKGEHDLPSQIDRTLAPYDDLVATALRPKQEDRYQTAAEFRDAIQQALVGVNPTISTDQLGAFMRELFSEEMTAQRELHERVAKAHLEDFQDQLTSQTGTTVSFALAAGPTNVSNVSTLPQPPALPPEAGHGGHAGKTPQPQQRPRQPTAQTDILVIQPQPAVAPATQPAPQPTTELSLADGTGAVSPEDVSVPQLHGRRGPIAIGIVAAVVLVGAIVFAMTRGGGESNPPDRVAQQGGGSPQPAPPPPKITVEPIDQPAPGPGSGSSTDPGQQTGPTSPESKSHQDPEIQLDPSPAPAPTATPKTPTHKKPTVRDPHRDHSLATTTPTPTPKVELTRDAVASKFRAVSNEYTTYKAKNGGRLDPQWDDLVTFMQFQLRADNLDDAVRRIDAFRAKLRE